MDVLVVVTAICGIVAVIASGKYTQYVERIRMCEAMAKSFEKCPECYVKGAAWLSEQWQTEMEKMGVDFGRK